MLIEYIPIMLANIYRERDVNLNLRRMEIKNFKKMIHTSHQNNWICMDLGFIFCVFVMIGIRVKLRKQFSFLCIAPLDSYQPKNKNSKSVKKLCMQTQSTEEIRRECVTCFSFSLLSPLSSLSLYSTPTTQRESFNAR